MDIDMYTYSESSKVMSISLVFFPLTSFSFKESLSTTRPMTSDHKQYNIR